VKTPTVRGESYKTGLRQVKSKKGGEEERERSNTKWAEGTSAARVKGTRKKKPECGENQEARGKKREK